MLTRILLLVSLLLAANAKAEIVQPLAITKQNNSYIVLTSYFRKEICPPGSYVAYSRSIHTEDTGCWVADNYNVILMWLPNYRITYIPKNMFSEAALIYGLEN